MASSSTSALPFSLFSDFPRDRWSVVAGSRTKNTYQSMINMNGTATSCASPPLYRAHRPSLSTQCQQK